MAATATISGQGWPNQTPFSERAQEIRAYTFLLREPDGERHPYAVRRNGQVVDMTGELTLFLNPEDVQKDHPAKVMIHQTPNGATVDSFGLGLPRWTFKGHTGWRARPFTAGLAGGTDGFMDGYLAFHAFSALIEEYYTENRRRAIAAAEPGGVAEPPLELIFRDYADDEWWVIEPEGLPSKTRTKDRVLFIEYLFRFTGLTNLKLAKKPVLDETGLALVGGNARFKKLAEVLADTIAKLEAANANLEKQLAADPSGKAAVEALMGCSLEKGQTETQQAQIARAQAYASAQAAQQEMDDWESGHDPTPAQQAAITSTRDAALAVQLDAACKSSTPLSLDALNLQSAVNSALAAGVGDPDVLGAAASDAMAATETLAAEVSAEPGGFSGFTLIGTVKGLVAQAKSLAADVQDFANGVKESIETPFKDVQALATDIRNTMQSLAFAVDLRNLTSPLRAVLRATRTQFRGLLCAVQSILSFPYNFVKGLSDGLDDIHSLFALSGCVSTFPRVKDVSWANQFFR